MGLTYSEPICQSAYDGDVHRLYDILSGDPDALNAAAEPSGDTALIAACRRGNVSTLRYLLANGADVHLTNKKRRTCLHYAAKRTFSLLDHLMILLLMPILLLGYFLMLQKQRQNMALMKSVLDTDIDVNAVDYKGNTALHYICQRKSHRLVPLLLERNAATDIQNKDGETPLDVAVRLKFHKIVRLLRKSQ